VESVISAPELLIAQEWNNNPTVDSDSLDHTNRGRFLGPFVFSYFSRHDGRREKEHPRTVRGNNVAGSDSSADFPPQRFPILS
jgi:hypothetical protein